MYVHYIHKIAIYYYFLEIKYPLTITLAISKVRTW